MSNEKRKKKHLSTLHTARLVGNLFILSGFVTVFLAIALRLVPTRIVQNSSSETATALVAETASVELENNVFSILQSYQGYFDNPMPYLTIALLFWAGYLLKTLAVLAETQLVEL